MTKIPTTADLRTHAAALATAFEVRLIEDPRLQPHEAVAMPHLRVALCSTITDETTYAVALHEIGHLASPTGTLRMVVSGNPGNLQRSEEDSAWTWARHYALIWTAPMEAVATYAEGTYAERPTPMAPAAPKPFGPPSIKWNQTQWRKK
jgi:hypothetical protein